MNDLYNKNLKVLAQNLRKNMTGEERHLWYDFLKTLPYPVKRQKIIANYIVDFYIPELSLIIEIDGGQHYEDKHKIKDNIRDEFLAENSCFVLRYSNSEINNQFESVCEDILNYIEKLKQKR